MGTSIAEFTPAFQQAIQGLMAVCNLTIGSGYRTYEEQARLYAQKPHLAAPPGQSNHGNPATGAVDLDGDLDCAHANAGRFGLHFPMDHEPWHIELIDPNAEVSAQAYTDPVEQQMVDLEGILFGNTALLNNPVDDPDELAAEYQQSKPPDDTLDWDAIGASGLSAAEWALQNGTAGSMADLFAGGRGESNLQATGQAGPGRDPDGGGRPTVGDALAGRSIGAALTDRPDIGAALAAAQPTQVSPTQNAKALSNAAPTGPGAAQGSGGALSPVQVASYYAAAGFRGEALVTMVAIAKGESGHNPTAHGDTSIAGGGWGHSIGLSQIRSRVSESGKGTPRDPLRLEDPAFNAKAAFEISGGGTNFKPWTVYTKGLYTKNLDEARAAVAQLGNLGAYPAANQQQPAPQARLDLLGGATGGLVGPSKTLAGVSGRPGRMAAGVGQALRSRGRTRRTTRGVLP